MRATTLTVLLLGSAGLSCGPGGDSPHESDGWCGDGVVDADEACDDGNTLDGDGCSATCEVDYPEPSCVSLIETVDAVQGDVLVTDDGRVLVTGQLDRGDGIRRGWVGAYELDGQPQWSLEFDDRDGVGVITQIESGFAFVAGALDGPSEIVSIDGSGHVTGTYVMMDDDPNVGSPYALLDTSNGLLLGGMLDNDLWLARLDDGQLTTLVHEDHVGLYDAISHLRRQGDTIVALATIGAHNLGNGDSIRFDTVDTWFIEYDDQGQQLRKTVLTSGEENISIRVIDLALAADGTWLLAGEMHEPNYHDPGGLGWAAAIRNGEVLWTVASVADVETQHGRPFCRFAAAAASAELLLGGYTGSTEGVRRWLVRLDVESGALLDEMVGAPVEVGPDVYHDGAAYGEQAVFVGNTRKQDSVEQWLCKTPI